MSVGFSTDKNAVDQRAGSLTLQLRTVFDQIQAMKVWLDAQSDVTLQGLGYTAGDITILRASFTDLDNLRKIAHAQGTQASTNDFFFNAGKLTGVQ
jgi:hypothetical protein